MTYAICAATCTYCGVSSIPVVECDALGGFVCEIECHACKGRKTGHIRIVVGFEETLEEAVARAESLLAVEH